MSESQAKRFPKPPSTMRPDRTEIVRPVGSGHHIQISHDVDFECFVGAHNQARRLTTGLVTLAPSVELPYHTHTFTESITLLAGKAVVEVEGRRYTLGVLDNVTIPRDTAHEAINASKDKPAIFHIAMATIVKRPEPLRG